MLEQLLGPDEPHATFHDAGLLRLTVDYKEATCVMDWELFVGDPDSTIDTDREQTRAGRLTFTGLLFCAFDPPEAWPIESGGFAWLSDDGPLSEAPTETGRKLALRVAPEHLGWWLFFNDTNAFAYVAAASATFDWV